MYLSLSGSLQDRTGTRQVQYPKDRHFLVNSCQAHIQARRGRWKHMGIPDAVILRTPPPIDLRAGFRVTLSQLRVVPCQQRRNDKVVADW
jgi:hypothetical protein